MVSYLSFVVPRSYQVSSGLDPEQRFRPPALTLKTVRITVNSFKIRCIASNRNYDWLVTSFASKLEQMCIGHVHGAPPFGISQNKAHVSNHSRII